MKMSRDVAAIKYLWMAPVCLLVALWGGGGSLAVAGNPVLPGYFADPSVSQFDGKFYIYATTDGYGWGGATGPMVCWESTDFVHWQHRGPIIPDQGRFLYPWAPGHVIKIGNKYVIYPSLDGQIYAMVSDSPAGPFTNALNDKPLIPSKFTPAGTIDGEPFEDDDGQRYFYYGNGQCYGMKLGADGTSIVGQPVKLTPPNYVEGPYVFKRQGKYYLMWSYGNCCSAEYQVHYAVADAPLGPFKYDPARNPILSSDFSDPNGLYISGPGHHSVLHPQGTADYYILYHRHPYPWFNGLNRRVAIDRMEFDADGGIKKIKGTYAGIGALGPSSSSEINLAQGKPASASSALDTTVEVAPQIKKYPEMAKRESFPDREPASGAFDDDFNSRWSAATLKVPQWLQVDLEKAQAIVGTEIFFEHPTILYSYKIETSLNGQKWSLYADRTRDEVMEAPKVDRKSVTARYVRLTILGTHSSSLEPEIWKSNDPKLQKVYREALGRYHAGVGNFGIHSQPVGVWEFRVLGAGPAK